MILFKDFHLCFIMFNLYFFTVTSSLKYLFQCLNSEIFTSTMYPVIKCWVLKRKIIQVLEDVTVDVGFKVLMNINPENYFLVFYSMFYVFFLHKTPVLHLNQHKYTCTCIGNYIPVTNACSCYI